MRVDPFSWIENPNFEMGDVGWTKEGRWAIVNDPTHAPVFSLTEKQA